MAAMMAQRRASGGVPSSSTSGGPGSMGVELRDWGTGTRSHDGFIDAQFQQPKPKVRTHDSPPRTHVATG
jgi:hypothetical protein